MSRLNLPHWQARWAKLSDRERTWVRVAASVLALALLWQIGLAPALGVWQHSPDRRAQLDRQQAELAALQAQVRSLQAQPTLSRQEAQQSLAQLTRDLLPGAQLSGQGDSQRVVLKNVSGTSLAQWLSAIRQSAQTTVTAMQLQRSTGNPTIAANAASAASAASATSAASAISPTSPDHSAQWDGQITVQLPAPSALRGAP